MKKQYFGDINDYRKYGLLRQLSGQGKLKTAVCWMLTKDDDGPDGKFTAYLKEPEKWRQYDTDLFDSLKNIVLEKKERNVKEAENCQIIPSALFYSDILPDDKQGRKEYFKAFNNIAKSCDLIFFDPDNGIEIKTKPYGREGSSKYLYWKEIKNVFSVGCSLLIYQHFPRTNRDEFIKSTASQLAINTGAQLVYSFRSKHVLFLLACQEEHREPFQDTIQSIKKKWGAQFEITSYINKEIREGEFEITSHSMFSIHRIQQLRQRAEKASQVLEEGTEGWSKSKVDPMKLLLSFPSLRLKKGFILRAYQFRSGGNGNGIVWAMPENLPFPDPKACYKLKDIFLEPPKPNGALDDIMEVIEGNETPWSYFSASLFARGVVEFGAMWHGCAWSEEVILGEYPLSSSESPYGNSEDWHWLELKPSQWWPGVHEDKDVVTVTFYTYSALGCEEIYRHQDTYKPGQYCFKSDRKVIAEGPGGFIF